MYIDIQYICYISAAIVFVAYLLNQPTNTIIVYANEEIIIANIEYGYGTFSKLFFAFKQNDSWEFEKWYSNYGYPTKRIAEMCTFAALMYLKKYSKQT